MTIDGMTDTKGRCYQVLFRASPRAEPVIHYTRPVTDIKLAREVLALRRVARKCGYVSPYSLRRIDG